jgi:hypothetical protein
MEKVEFKTINEFMDYYKVCPKCGRTTRGGYQFLPYGGSPGLGMRLTKDSSTIAQLEDGWGVKDPKQTLQISLDDDTCFGNYEVYKNCFVIVQTSCHPYYECNCCDNPCEFYVNVRLDFDAHNYILTENYRVY